MHCVKYHICVCVCVGMFVCVCVCVLVAFHGNTVRFSRWLNVGRAKT